MKNTGARSKLILSAGLIAGAILLAGFSCLPGLNENLNQENANVSTVNLNTASTIDTSDWLTYTNEEYGFSLRYPHNFSVEFENEPFGKVGSDFGDIYIDANDQSCAILLTKPNKERYLQITDALESGKFFNQTNFEKVEFNHVYGIKYTEQVNEQHEEGTVYSLVYGEVGFDYFVRSGVTNAECNQVSLEIGNTIQPN